MGSLPYMAPEQARGEPVGCRADVFGLGGILCDVLTGRPPFVGGSRLEVLRRASADDLSGAFARLEACGADAELVALCKRCLAPAKADRPADAGEVARAVAALRAAADERARRAEVERERAEVRAAEQRKRSRLRLALAVAAVVLVAGVGGAAWWRHEKAAQTRAGVTAALEQAEVLRKQYRFTEAEALLKTAGDLAASNARDRSPTVEQARAGLALVVKLDDIRMRRSTWIAEPGGKGRFDLAGAVRDYPEAFRSAGLDLLGTDPDALAAAVTASPVRAELIAALDDWAALPLDEPIQGRILGLLRRADPGPWRDSFRDPAVHRSPMALVLLARSANVDALLPGTLTALADLMERHGLDPTPLLLRAQLAHPRDFLIPFALGQWHFAARRFSEAIAHYRTARAVRAGSYPLRINLGYALRGTGDPDGAITVASEAIRLDPTNGPARQSLGLALSANKDYDGAIGVFRESIRLDPRNAKAHYNLGLTLHSKGDYGGGAAAFRAAIRLDPNNPATHRLLGAALRMTGDLDGAIEHLTEAIRLDPKDSIASSTLKAVRAQKDERDARTAPPRPVPPKP
jgi:Flp pilus assembly protein TadD